MDASIEAYILKTIDYQEHSKLVYLYTPEGQKSALARGVKKMQNPLRHLVQAGTLATITLSKGTLPTLKEGTIERYTKAIKEDLIKTTILSTVNDLIYYNVTETDDHPKLFRFLKKFIHALNAREDSLELLMVFEMKLLAFLGYLIQFKHCYLCSETEDLVMEEGTGLIACPRHKNPERKLIPAALYHPLHYYLHCDVLTFKSQNIDLKQQKALMQIIDALYQNHLAFSSKAKKLLMTLL